MQTPFSCVPYSSASHCYNFLDKNSQSIHIFTPGPQVGREDRELSRSFYVLFSTHFACSPILKTLDASFRQVYLVLECPSRFRLYNYPLSRCVSIWSFFLPAFLSHVRLTGVRPSSILHQLSFSLPLFYAVCKLDSLDAPKGSHFYC